MFLHQKNTKTNFVMVQKYLYNDTNRPKNAPITVQKGTYVCTKATFYLTFNPKSITYSNDIQPQN